MRVPKVAAINDLSGLGRCSLTAAIPILSAMGVQACPLPTAVLSNQTGFESFASIDLSEQISRFSHEWRKRGVIFDGIYTGFLNGPAQAGQIADWIDQFRTPQTHVLVDPVLGDRGHIYPVFDRAMVTATRALIAKADIITPNLTEACILAGVGYEEAMRSDGMEAVRLCRDNDYDVILMDVMMPKLDGFSAVKEIKKFKDIPVIMLSARGEEYDKLFGFEIGVDDYVTKPFSPKEVMARINAVTKRHSAAGENANPDVYKFEGLTVDMVGRNVYVDGEKAELTPKEYEILFYFIKNKGIALTREKLLYDVWGFDFYGDDRTVDTHIKMLRANLKQYRKFIVTLRGLGYKFEA